MAHQVHWVRARARTLEQALAAFDDQVVRVGHVDNWFNWELARLDDGTVLSRDPSAWRPDDLELFVEPSTWLRATWTELYAHVGLDGVRGPVIGALHPNDPEERGWLVGPPPEERRSGLLPAIRRGLATPPKPEWPRILHESWQARLADALLRVEALSAAELAQLPFVRGAAPDDWPAHEVGEGDGMVLLAVDMHH